MFRRVVLALALASALTGCVAAPPSGPLVEYRDGLTPITRPVKCAATYVLRSDDGAAVLAEHGLAKGERVGFRREEDGSVVAVAPGYTIVLPPGAYRWDVVRASVAPWRERFLCETREYSLAAGRTTLMVVGTVCILTALFALVLLYAWAESGSNSFGYNRRR